MKLLHLIVDHQVVERALGMYETLFPGDNDVLVFARSKNFKHLDAEKRRVVVNRENLAEVVADYDFSEVKYVIAHYLTFEMIDFIKQIPSQIHFCWEIYGCDLYDQFLGPKGYELYFTNPNKYEKYGFFRRFLPGLFDIFLILRGKKNATRKYVNCEFNYLKSRVNSLGVCTSADALLYSNYFGVSIPYFLFCNYSLHETLGELYDYPFVDSSTIMVGNSASFSNNHLYVLQYLKQYCTSGDYRINLVMSYGGTLNYRNDVAKEYEKCFPGRVNLIKDYLPLHEYNKIFTTIGILILSAWRQESIGTIIMGFNLGIKIYMSKKSPLFQDFQSLGFHIYELESATPESFHSPMSIEEKQFNRRRMREIYDESLILSNLRKHFL